MPGILPMKVIKVGNSSQARIAQACDRCRSKKIKCDGIRPCCSQCANVGFECKTSDKLSRRAFPRGYTESLEERVRLLEAEVRELKDLLDEKDEKIDMLSKMHSNRRASHASISPVPSMDSREESSLPKDDVFRVQASPLLLGSGNVDLYFVGASSGRAFIDAFKRKIQETGKSCSTFTAEAFLNVQRDFSADQANNLSRIECIPPRLFSDKCVQIFWQEWAPLFPVLYKSSFLRLYDEYVSDPEKMTDNHKLAQLHLVFGIAALSSDHPDENRISICETQWQTSLDAILMENTLLTLQCLILATLYSLIKGDYQRLQQYKGISVALSHRLGLHQSQKRFSFGALTMEMRKKTFWTLYTVDCFSAATIGLPVLLNEEDIHCEYPMDIDDEYVTEKGFLPTLPGESSKVSAALALFRVSRILSKVLMKNYPAAASHDLSLQLLSALETELNEWSDNLPPHLKLTFVQDKPSTDITGDRSALLSLAYYYIRTLIHRPAVGSSLGSKASSSVISLAESSKHIIQIIQLLEERSMSFSFSVNKNEVLTLCGLSLLYQGLDLKQEGKLMKDGQRLVCTVVKCLEKAKAPSALDFRRLAASIISGDSSTNVSRQSVDSEMPAPFIAKSTPSPNVPQKQPLQQSPRYSKIACSTESDLLQPQKERFRRATLPNSIYKHSNISQSSLDSMYFGSPTSRCKNESSVLQMLTPASMRSQSSSSISPKTRPNLDYLSLSSSGSPVSSQTHHHVSLRTSSSRNPQVHTHHFPTQGTPASAPSTSQNKTSSVTPAEWESLLSALDSGDSNIYDAVYGGPSISLTTTLPTSSYHTGNPSSSNNNNNNYNHPHSTAPALSDLSLTDHALTNTLSNASSSAYGDWSSDAWDMTVIQPNDFDLSSGPAQSVLSFSEESLSSGDDLDGFGLGTGNGTGSGRHSFDDLYRNTASLISGDRFLFDGLEGGFEL